MENKIQKELTKQMHIAYAEKQRLNAVTKKTICIDLDGTICDENGDYAERKPLPGAAEALAVLAKSHIIVIHTARHFNLYHLTADWLMNHNIIFHSLVMGKPAAALYIDNRGKAFTSWENTLKELSE